MKKAKNSGRVLVKAPDGPTVGDYAIVKGEFDAEHWFKIGRLAPDVLGTHTKSGAIVSLKLAAFIQYTPKAGKACWRAEVVA